MDGEKRKIVLALKDNLSRRPPVLNVCMILLELGYKLDVIASGISEETRAQIEKSGGAAHVYNPAHPLRRIPVLGRVVAWLKFRRFTLKTLKKISFDYLWMGSADATVALGRSIEKFNYILQIQELYDEVPHIRWRLRRAMNGAALVFVPEATRAHIFRAWYRLKETPAVLPNKPLCHPRRRNLPITDPVAAEAFAKIPAGSRVVLYQGGVHRERNIAPVAAAVHALGAPWVLAVQGFANDHKRKGYDELRRKYGFYPIPFVYAPHHLEVTSNVDFGVVAYKHVHLNNEFCAPNKIWEYSGFGIPMIGNDVMGLENTIGKSGAGECVNFETCSVEELKKILLKMADRMEEYSSNARKMFESVDLKKLVRDKLEGLPW